MYFMLYIPGSSTVPVGQTGIQGYEILVTRPLDFLYPLRSRNRSSCGGVAGRAFNRALITDKSSSSATMSFPVGGGESYPGSNLSVSQLLDAAKRKLRDTMFCGRCVFENNPCHLRTPSAETQIPQDCRDRRPI